MAGVEVPSSYRILDTGGVAAFIESLPAIRARLGGERQRWRVMEVGDGNLNLVFIVQGPAGSVCLKQALPYVRVAGASWPMTLERAFFEASYYAAVAPWVGGLIPKIYHYDPELYCTVMECLSPHIILRQGLIAGRRYPQVARDIGEYIARASFFTSDFARPFEHKLDGVALFARNKQLLRITVELVFCDPYRASPRNRHTSPQLDPLVAELRSDGPLKVAAAHFGQKFLGDVQALVHGDLHSGSVRNSRSMDLSGSISVHSSATCCSVGTRNRATPRKQTTGSATSTGYWLSPESSGSRSARRSSSCGPARRTGMCCPCPCSHGRRRP
jgi:5-methylthioribose kinase